MRAAGTTTPSPAPAPLVCGALGRYDRDRVESMAALLGAECREAHSDRDSILMLDREPLRWQGRRQLGLGWIEAELWRGRSCQSWEGAAEAGACGLVLEGRRRFLHSSANGIGPIYWLESGRATYFASRIDPLVQTNAARLSIDWDAWAAIIALRYPLGERTPFAEISRLGPSTTLRRRRGRGQAQAQRWPWSEVEPTLGAEDGAEAVAAALRSTLAPLAGEPVLCPLSGGLDSRLICAALASGGGEEILTLTVGDDEGDSFEEDLAAPVARLFGLPQERPGGAVDTYRNDWRERALRVEHQFVDHAWLVPLARRIAGPTPVTDGFALDTFMQTGVRFHTSEVVAPETPREGSRALFDSSRRYGHAHHALALQFHAPLIERSRTQFLRAVEPFEGHHAQPTVSLYATRTVRGISTYPSGLLGREAPIIAPGASDSVARALLAIPAAAKTERRLQRLTLAQLSPSLADLPSTADTARRPPQLPRRWRSPVAAEMHLDLLSSGPFAPFVSPDLLAWLRAPARGELSPDLRLGMEGVSLLHSWWRRYRDRLRPVDPDDLLG